MRLCNSLDSLAVCCACCSSSRQCVSSHLSGLLHEFTAADKPVFFLQDAQLPAMQPDEFDFRRGAQASNHCSCSNAHVIIAAHYRQSLHGAWLDDLS